VRKSLPNPANAHNRRSQKPPPPLHYHPSGARNPKRPQTSLSHHPTHPSISYTMRKPPQLTHPYLGKSKTSPPTKTSPPPGTPSTGSTHAQGYRTIPLSAPTTFQTRPSNNATNTPNQQRTPPLRAPINLHTHQTPRHTTSCATPLHVHRNRTKTARSPQVKLTPQSVNPTPQQSPYKSAEPDPTPHLPAPSHATSPTTILRKAPRSIPLPKTTNPKQRRHNYHPSLSPQTTTAANTQRRLKPTSSVNTTRTHRPILVCRKRSHPDREILQIYQRSYHRPQPAILQKHTPAFPSSLQPRKPTAQFRRFANTNLNHALSSLPL